MATIQIALVKQTDSIGDEELKRVAAALQKQVNDDLKPAWDVEADIIAAKDRAPKDTWPVFITDHPPGGYAGVHTRRADGLPWAVVSTKRDWRLAASHELIEMLVDRSGDKTVPSRGLALDGQDLRDLDVEFEYLLEICDPIEDTDHAYLIDDIPVSDFYTPNYFDPVFVAGRVYSINGAITRPREVRPGGYLSWRHPETKKLQQLRNFGSFTVVDLPEHGPAPNQSLRMFVDLHTETPRLYP